MCLGCQSKRNPISFMENRNTGFPIKFDQAEVEGLQKKYILFHSGSEKFQATSSILTKLHSSRTWGSWGSSQPMGLPIACSTPSISILMEWYTCSYPDIVPRFHRVHGNPEGRQRQVASQGILPSDQHKKYRRGNRTVIRGIPVRLLQFMDNHNKLNNHP